MKILCRLFGHHWRNVWDWRVGHAEWAGNDVANFCVRCGAAEWD